MRELVETLRHFIMFAGVAALVIVGLLCLAWHLRGVPNALRKFFGLHSLAALLSVVCVWYGGGKTSFSFDTGLRDNGSYAKNNTVYVAWTYTGIPSASSLYVAYRERGTNNKWADLGETVVSALVWEGTLANATNYEYLVYTTYVPPSPVHTNGVWQGPAYETKERRGANSFIIIGAEVREHGRAIAPPNAKRKEDEDE